MLTTLPFLDSDDENGDTKNRLCSVHEHQAKTILIFGVTISKALFNNFMNCYPMLVKFTNVEEHNALGFLLDGLIATKTTFINPTNSIFHLGWHV